jgi:hypothetical protein
MRGRLLYGLLYPLGAVAVLAGAIGGDRVGTLLFLTAVLGVPAGVCELRARRMGFAITSEGIELIRALNRSVVPWERVNRFVLRKPPGAVDYGQRVVWIEQSNRGVLPRGSLPVPTLYITPKNSRLFRWMGPSGVKWQGGRISDTAAFLDELLATHRPEAPNPRLH